MALPVCLRSHGPGIAHIQSDLSADAEYHQGRRTLQRGRHIFLGYSLVWGSFMLPDYLLLCELSLLSVTPFLRLCVDASLSVSRDAFVFCLVATLAEVQTLNE